MHQIEWLLFEYPLNLIFLNFTDIEKKLKKNDFIENFEIKKIYPNKLKIKIYEAKPLAILQNKKKKFYVYLILSSCSWLYACDKPFEEGWHWFDDSQSDDERVYISPLLTCLPIKLELKDQ